uniref:Aspartyl-tRNA synthetase n=1 Tax=Rhodosorus marinus TaxID=101924 RepID=A0A7S3E9Z8_9RHOD|mmetsp:Transcript_19696/g.78294  ORF Transcript_19696/g.78294 Transcript_19696/m.78294 type:complete len:327 (+) Transcript_19696:372-1352(+)
MLLRCVWRESRRSCFWFSYRGIRMAGIGGTEWTAEMEAEIRAIAEREMPEDMTAEDKKVVREARKKMKEIEKAKKKERKAAAAAAAVNLAESARVDDVEYLDASKEPEQIYGDYKLIQSRCAKTGSGRKFTKVEALDASQIGKQLWIRARLHNVRAVAKNAFLILRQKTSSAQAVLSPSDTIPREMIKWALKNITTESVIDVQGQIVESEVKSCTQNTIEIAVQRLYVVSKAAQPLPFLPDDAARPVHEEGVHVDRKTRLDARIVDLRVQAHQAIFRIQSGKDHPASKKDQNGALAGNCGDRRSSLIHKVAVLKRADCLSQVFLLG